MLKNVYEGLYARLKVYFCKMYPTCKFILIPLIICIWSSFYFWVSRRVSCQESWGNLNQLTPLTLTTSPERAKCLSRFEFNCKLLLNVKNRSKGDLKALCVRNSLRKKRDYVGSFSKMGVGGGLPPFPPLNINLPCNFCHAKLILRCKNKRKVISDHFEHLKMFSFGER